jgi:hypothetical protein
MILESPPNRVSLRLWHPSLDPDEMSRVLGLAADRSWRAGEPRTTPKGRPIGGKRDESYWCHPVAETGSVADVVAKVLDRLEAHRAWVDEFRRTGGRVEVYLWLVGTTTAGDSFSSELVARLGRIGAEISLEVLSVAPRR